MAQDFLLEPHQILVSFSETVLHGIVTDIYALLAYILNLRTHILSF